MTSSNDRYIDIRPLLDSEVPETIARLVSDKGFKLAVEPIVKPLSWEQFTNLITGCKTKFDFQKQVIYPFLKILIDRTTTETTGFGWDNIDVENSYLFISNHRDIILDAALFNILLVDKEIQTTENAIGDNLLIYPWIVDLVRLNKSFIVKRNVSVRHMLEVSHHLSDYIHHTVNQRKQSIWIAQGEGRAKDSNDKTRTSLLKMLTLHDSRNPLEMLKQLRIVPLSISYEYDPCDFLKAKEFHLKRDHPDHKKTHADDIESMATGMLGFKGRITFRLGKCINQSLNEIPTNINRNELLDRVATLIDNNIYSNYTFFPFNYIAYDMMTGSKIFANKYNETEREQFENYIQKQISKIDVPNKDADFLQNKLIEMYGNPVKNHLSARNDL